MDTKHDDAESFPSDIPGEILAHVANRSGKEFNDLGKWVREAAIAGLDDEAMWLSLTGSGWPHLFVDWYLKSDGVKSRASGAKSTEARETPHAALRVVPPAIAMLAGAYILLAGAIVVAISSFAVSFSAPIAWGLLASIGLVAVGRDILTRNAFGFAVSIALWIPIFVGFLFAGGCLLLMLIAVLLANSDPLGQLASAPAGLFTKPEIKAFHDGARSCRNCNGTKFDWSRLPLDVVSLSGVRPSHRFRRSTSLAYLVASDGREIVSRCRGSHSCRALRPQVAHASGHPLAHMGVQGGRSDQILHRARAA